MQVLQSQSGLLQYSLNAGQNIPSTQDPQIFRISVPSIDRHKKNLQVQGHYVNRICRPFPLPEAHVTLLLTSQECLAIHPLIPRRFVHFYKTKWGTLVIHFVDEWLLAILHRVKNGAFLAVYGVWCIWLCNALGLAHATADRHLK